MNIATKPAGQTTGDYATLIDDTQGGVIAETRWKGAAKMQEEALCAPPGATNAQFRQPVGNVSGVLPVKGWNISYASLDAALAATQAVPAAVLGTKVHIRITVGGVVVYYPNAVATSMETLMEGGTVTFDGSFATDAPTLADPSA